MTSPQQIQDQIEQTRATLSSDVDRLSEKVSPSRVMHRRMDGLRNTAGNVKDRVMGSAVDSAAASSVRDAASETPAAVRRQTQGSPIAAGLIAFGIGWLASSLVPASERERELAAQARDIAQETAHDLAEPVKQAGQEMAENLRGPAEQAVEQVKHAASDAAAETADQARSSAQQAAQPLQG
jgi:hypothetical protein